MSRYINIDGISLRKTISVGGLSAKALWRRIQQEPSIDIVFCKECKKRKTNKFCLEHMRYEKNDEGFCSYGQKGRASDEKLV